MTQKNLLGKAWPLCFFGGENVRSPNYILPNESTIYTYKRSQIPPTHCIWQTARPRGMKIYMVVQCTCTSAQQVLNMSYCTRYQSGKKPISMLLLFVTIQSFRLLPMTTFFIAQAFINYQRTPLHASLITVSPKPLNKL